MQPRKPNNPENNFEKRCETESKKQHNPTIKAPPKEWHKATGVSARMTKDPLKPPVSFCAFGGSGRLLFGVSGLRCGVEDLGFSLHGVATAGQGLGV